MSPPPTAAEQDAALETERGGMTLDTANRVRFKIPSPFTELTIGQFTERSAARKAEDDADTSSDVSTRQLQQNKDKNQNLGQNLRGALPGSGQGGVADPPGQGGTHYSGIGLFTAADVRFNTTGPYDPGTTTAFQSDLIAQSQGQLWLQAIGNVATVSGESTVIASPAATIMAGQGGITLLAGFRPDAIVTQSAAGVLPAAVTGYDSKVAGPTIAWGVLDTIAAVGLTALDIYATIADRPSIMSSKLGPFNAFGIQGSLANLAGMGVNIAALSGSKDVTLPGINMFAEAGILVGSAMGAVNLVGLPGLLLQSTFATQFALVSSSLRGLFSAGMSSLHSADVSALYDVSIRSDKSLTLASRSADLTLRGPEMKFGLGPVTTLAQMGATSTQKPTLGLKVQAVDDLDIATAFNPALGAIGFTDVEGKLVSFEAGPTGELNIDGGKEIKLEVADFSIVLKPDAGVAIGSGSAGAKMTMTNDGVLTIEGPGGTNQLVLGQGKVQLKAPGHEYTYKPGSICIKGAKIDLGG